MIENRVESPLLPLSIFRLRTLAGANVAGLLLGGSFFAFVFIGTLYMQQVLHYSALQSGVAWLAASLTSIALAGFSQLLVTRGGAKIVMAIGMTLIGAGVIWATQVPVHGHFLQNLAGPFLVASTGTAFAFIPISIAALAGVAEHQAGLASGLLNTSQQLGGAIGIAIATGVAASHTQALVRAGNSVPTALTGGFPPSPVGARRDRAARPPGDLHARSPRRTLRRRHQDNARRGAARAQRRDLTSSTAKQEDSSHDPTRDLSETTAIVVGASRGFVSGNTTAFAEAGPPVIAVARTAAPLADQAAERRQHPARGRRCR